PGRPAAGRVLAGGRGLLHRHRHRRLRGALRRHPGALHPRRPAQRQDHLPPGPGPGRATAAVLVASTAAASSRSSRSRTGKASAAPGTVTVRAPGTTDRSGRRADARTARGYCSCTSSSRGTVRTIRPPASTSLTVSVTSTTGTAASAPALTAATTATTRDAGASGTCGSCSTTISVPSGKYTGAPGGSTETTSTTPLPRNAEVAWSINVMPSSPADSMSSPETRTTPVTVMNRSGGEDLVEQHLGLVFVGPLGERELADEDLPGLGEHALLPRGQAALTVTPPQIPDDLGHLVHVAGGELLEIGLVAPGPVGRLLRVRCTQHLEHAVEAFLAHHVTHADDLGVRGRNLDGQIALGNLQHQIDLFLALDDAGLDGLDDSCPVVRVDDGLADLENHVCVTPFAPSRITRPEAELTLWTGRFRRSGPHTGAGGGLTSGDPRAGAPRSAYRPIRSSPTSGRAGTLRPSRCERRVDQCAVTTRTTAPAGPADLPGSTGSSSRTTSASWTRTSARCTGSAGRGAGGPGCA